MHLLVTRPEPDGASTAVKLRARGYEVTLAPLLQMQPLAADLGNGEWHALALTSANALRAIAAHPRLPSLLEFPVYVVGGRTAEAARELGFDAVISADGDAGDLIRTLRLHLRGAAQLLYLAGEDRSVDLAAALAGAGITVRTAVVYRAAAASELPGDVRKALAAGRFDGVLHFSRRTAMTYLDCAAAAGLGDKALTPTHFCLSPRVAEPLTAAGAARVLVAERPREADLIALTG